MLGTPVDSMLLRSARHGYKPNIFLHQLFNRLISVKVTVPDFGD